MGLQSELSQCKDEEKRRELKERLKECDEVSINFLYVDHYCVYTNFKFL